MASKEIKGPISWHVIDLKELSMRGDQFLDFQSKPQKKANKLSLWRLVERKLRPGSTLPKKKRKASIAQWEINQRKSRYIGWRPLTYEEA